MSTTSKPSCHGEALLALIARDKQLSADERRALVWAPFPVVRINTPKGHSQAPNTALALTHIQDGDF